MLSSLESIPQNEGDLEGPMRADVFKRAVYRSAPSKFSVQMLQPMKTGGSHYYGMQICSANDRSSISSVSTLAEYDIWRRWEDCLVFQETIEEEYRRMARAKRLRLKRGKGVRRNGFYKQDAASSWESLPPGPDPNSVGRNIHDYIPVLTRKGTVFRASQATIDKRSAELTAFIRALWEDDVPALISELRESHIVTDFFAFWRSDHDLAEKQRRQRLENSKFRNSVTSSIFSMYFSSSSSNDVSSYAESSASVRSSMHRSARVSPSRAAPRDRKASTSSSDGSPLPYGRRRAPSTGSSTFSPSTPSDSSLDSPVLTSVSVPTVADDLPTITFDHDPVQWQPNYIQERPAATLAILPEDREVCLKTDTSLVRPPVSRPQRKGSVGDTNPDRHGKIFLAPPSPTDVPLASDGLPSHPDHSVRESWQSVESAYYMLEGMNIALPSASPRSSSHRASMNSIATYRTDVSADGVLPRFRESRQLSPLSGSFTPRSRIVSAPISVSEYDDNWSDTESDILDTFLADSFPIPSFDVPHVEVPDIIVDSSITSSCPSTPLRSDYPSDVQFSPSSRVPTSPAKSATFSVSTTMTAIPDTFTIKAKFKDSFVVLRVPDEISYKDLRQRLFSKFVGQEGVPLSDSFKITYMQSLFNNLVDSKPIASGAPTSTSNTPYIITSQGDWENVAACVEGNKLVLIITDNTP